LSYGQNWKKIAGTNIEYSHFTLPDSSNWSKVPFEYFRKGDRVIGVARHLTSDFYSLFKETASAFDMIFNSSGVKTEPGLDRVIASDYDSSVFKIKFKEALMIENREVTFGYKEIIWQLEIHSWSAFDPHPCFINVVFNAKKNLPKPGEFGFKFVIAFDGGCEI